MLAGQFVGDKDVRTLQRSYVRERAEQLRGVADGIGAITGAVRPALAAGADRENGERTADAPSPGEAPAPPSTDEDPTP